MAAATAELTAATEDDVPPLAPVPSAAFDALEDGGPAPPPAAAAAEVPPELAPPLAPLL